MIIFLLQPCIIKAEELLWPIESYNTISSSFGEPRPGRFHYGLDFRSGGVIGKEIYSIGDGYISRITTSPRGYGKALYLRLDTGETIVYAHLSRFMPEIEDRLFTLRIKNRTYDIDWWPQSGEFRVTKGELIAYSGDSGGVPPHLHFEFRDEDNNPLNPLNHGINITDTIPPHINYVFLLPLDKNSSIDGFPVARRYDFSLPDSETFHISGRIGLAVSAWDKVNEYSNSVGIYRISLAIDSTTVFSKQYDEISYAANVLSPLDYLNGTSIGADRYMVSLFRREGNTLDFYEGNGILTNAYIDSTHDQTLRIYALDYANNKLEKTLPISFSERPRFDYCGYNGDGTFRFVSDYTPGTLDRLEIRKLSSDNEWILEHNYRIGETTCNITVITPELLTRYKVSLVASDSTKSLPVILQINPKLSSKEYPDSIAVTSEMLHDRIVVRISSHNELSSVPMLLTKINGIVTDDILCPVPESETSWITSVALPEAGNYNIQFIASAYDRLSTQITGSAEIDCTVLPASSDASVYAPDSLFALHADAGSLYRSMPAMVMFADAIPADGLKKVSNGYEICLGDEPLRNSLSVTLIPEIEPSEKSGLFFMNGNGDTNSDSNHKWNFISNDKNGSTFTGTIGGSGIVAMFEDAIPPAVVPMLPKPGSSITSRRPLLRAHVEDSGSGIEGSDSFRMSIDGIPIYGEYDFRADHISYRIHNNLSPGEHTVRITVTDRIGNERTREWKFRIVE